tara:strand:- start:23592 stop:25295 length:1704 start_codon:yes stop_codon:yes gene_type:complete
MISNQKNEDTGKQVEDLNIKNKIQPKKNEPVEISGSKLELKAKMSNWWQQEKDKIVQGDMLKFLQDNKGRLDKTMNSIHQNNFLYRLTNRLFAFISVIAGWIDKAKDLILNLFLKLPAPSVIKGFIRSAVDAINFKGFVGFINAKFYSLKNAPHHLPSLQIFEDMLSHAKQDGFDVKKYFPDLSKKYQHRKQQLLQHSFFKEFSKTWIEKVLATPFSISRSLSPVLPDSRLWHKFFDILERRHIKDLILVSESGERTSFKYDPQYLIDSCEVKQRLYQASLLKSTGRRVFIIGHHESYVGPYLVRSVLRRLGFENLAANCNTVVGPKMFSNIVLKNGASNVGNLFLTLPSQKTTVVNEKDLATALAKTARQTQFLIKMPNQVLRLIEGMSYHDFMNRLVRFERISFEEITNELIPEDKFVVREYFNFAHENHALDELEREDFELFKKVMYEPFLIFPEGSRSYVEKNGDITMKYVNPRFMQAYLRPGDVILPLNLVGGSDITKGLLLSVANMGLSVGEPFEVSQVMIDNYEVEGLNVMRKIAALPNIKQVFFDEDIQGKTGLGKHAA